MDDLGSRGSLVWLLLPAPYHQLTEEYRTGEVLEEREREGRRRGERQGKKEGKREGKRRGEGRKEEGEKRSTEGKLEGDHLSFAR